MSALFLAASVRNHGAIFKAKIMAENKENNKKFIISQSSQLQKFESDSVPEHVKKQTSCPGFEKVF